MAVIHITEEEAVRDLAGLLAKVREGMQVHIADHEGAIAILQPPTAPARKTLSGALRWAKEQNADVLLDGEFEKDLDAVICNHEHDAVRYLWED
jgi:antitoxin (DNA-binding transcriptional repressor) of toxin-antitoxin stability system